VNRVFGIFLAALVLAWLFAEIGCAQSFPTPPPQVVSPNGRGPFGRHPLSRDDGEEQQSDKPLVAADQAQLNRERYLELKKETSELARLANELKLAVAESDEQVLPLELARKADRVERLSKRIRDRIKHGY
jgi:hypothetical protein